MESQNHPSVPELDRLIQRVRRLKDDETIQYFHEILDYFVKVRMKKSLLKKIISAMETELNLKYMNGKEDLYRFPW